MLPHSKIFQLKLKTLGPKRGRPCSRDHYVRDTRGCHFCKSHKFGMLPWLVRFIECHSTSQTHFYDWAPGYFIVVLSLTRMERQLKKQGLWEQPFFRCAECREEF